MIWVLVDISYLGYRALRAVGDLEFEDVPTGIIFGFFHQLRQICLDDRIKSNKIAIFCDSRSSLRSKVYPDYKGQRRQKRTEEEIKRIRSMRTQMDLLTASILPDLGFRVFYQEGLESDDIMAWAARRLSINARLRGSYARQGVMITGDGDLFQCINPWIHWYDPQRNIYFTEESFLLDRGISAKEWGIVKTLAGCSSDNVKGIPKVGEKTAIQYLLGELPPLRAAHQAIVSIKGKEIVRRNRGLVILPHEETDPISLRDPVYDVERFFKVCRRFGLRSILDDKSSWRAFFEGKFLRVRRRGE